MRALSGPLTVAGLCMVVTSILSGCGSAPTSSAAPTAIAATGDATPPVTAHGTAAKGVQLGDATWYLDQLAPPPQPAPGDPVLLAVLRVTSDAPPHTITQKGIELLDSRGARWLPVPIPGYAPIDKLDGDPIAPDHGAAGVVAFRLPPGRRGVAVLLRDSATTVSIDAPA